MKYIKHFENFQELNALSKQYNSFNLSESDLKDIAKQGLIDSYSDSSVWYETDNLDEAINMVVESFKSFLSKPYPVELGNFPNIAKIYRLLRLKSSDDLNQDNYGISWFSNPDQYKKEGFYDMLPELKSLHNEHGTVYLLTAEVNIQNVDVFNTLWQRDIQWLENEIVLKNGKNINLLSIEVRP